MKLKNVLILLAAAAIGAAVYTLVIAPYLAKRKAQRAGIALKNAGAPKLKAV